MTIDEVVASLDLPADCRVNSKVAKKLLADHGATTAADRRQIREAIEDVRWLAALKEQTIGVAPYVDERREYLEIAVLSLRFRPGIKADRVPRVVHRAIPYPVLLLAEQGDAVQISAAPKRRSESDSSKAVLEREPLVAEITPDTEAATALLGSLSVAGLPRSSMLTLYGGFLDRLVSFLAAQLTGEFVLSESDQRSSERLDALEAIERMDLETEKMRKAAKKTSQLRRQMELNLKIKRLQVERSEAMAILSVAR